MCNERYVACELDCDITHADQDGYSVCEAVCYDDYDECLEAY